jgi:hypothetical protein
MTTKVVRIQTEVVGNSVIITTFRAAARGRLLRHKSVQFSRGTFRARLGDPAVLKELGIEIAPPQPDIP